MNADDTQSMDAGKREMLRHTLATVAYRGRKILTGAPSGFSFLLEVRSIRVEESGA